MRFRKKARRTTRRFGAKRYSKHSGLSPTKLIMGSVIYGAGRQTLVNLASPLTSMIPLGQYADEAVLGLAGYYAAKKGKGIIKDIGMSMLAVESASLGSQLIGGAFGGGNTSGGAF